MNRREVWLVDFSPQTGAEITKRRPAIIASDDGLAPLPTRIVVPVRNFKPEHRQRLYYVALLPDAQNGLAKESTADCTQVKSLDKSRFIHKIGTLEPQDFDKVMDGVALCLGL